MAAVCVLCISALNLSAQPILTADGLAAFTPDAVAGGGGVDDLTGISLRYVADDVAGTDGTAVSSWPDSGGRGFNATQATSGNQPVIKVGVVNGHRAVQFDGVNDVLTTNLATAAISSDTTNTVFIVLKQDGSQAQNCVMRSESATTFDIYATYIDVLYFDYGNTGTARVNGSQPTGWDNAWHILECHRTGANMSILVDGVSVASRADASGSFSQAGTANFNIGAFDSSGTIPFKGQIAEIRDYSIAKDSTSSATIRGALKTTYGTP